MKSTETFDYQFSPAFATIFRDDHQRKSDEWMHKATRVSGTLFSPSRSLTAVNTRGRMIAVSMDAKVGT